MMIRMNKDMGSNLHLAARNFDNFLPLPASRGSSNFYTSFALPVSIGMLFFGLDGDYYFLSSYSECYRKFS